MLNPDTFDGAPAETLPEPPLRMGPGCIAYGPMRLVWGRRNGQIIIPLPGGEQVQPEELMRMARREGYKVVWPFHI